ncbi:VOC family protein [Clostridium sp. MSJ-11]|uniref:VOC family protein n=1 Tax=Clostridium mobile TaxID=2841512 RepID=A0ABS6EGF7_9CLOT|nr:VOC family protein [Clostridium mobile]MBU5484085.1 VOC family protein [Clostridium mobile]
MKLNSTLIAVKNIKKSREFYERVLNQKVILDFGENITFDGDFSLQSKLSWQGFIDKDEKDIIEKSNNFELYFEEENFEDFMDHLNSFNNIEFVHAVKEYPWGQRVVRFYDPDSHIIEVGESMRSVVKRFLASGMTIEEASKRSQYPVDFVKSCIE